MTKGDARVNRLLSFKEIAERTGATARYVQKIIESMNEKPGNVLSGALGHCHKTPK